MINHLDSIVLLFVCTLVLGKYQSAEVQKPAHASDQTSPKENPKMTPKPMNCLSTCAEHTREIKSTISLLGAANLFLHQDVTDSLCNLFKGKCKQKMKDANDCVVAFEKTDFAGKANALAACCPKFKDKYNCLKDFIVRECSGIEQKLLFDSFQKTFNYMRYTESEEDLLVQGNSACDDLLSGLAQAEDNSSPFLSDYDVDGANYDNSLNADNSTGTYDDLDDTTDSAVNAYSSFLPLFGAALFGQVIVVIGF